VSQDQSERMQKILPYRNFFLDRKLYWFSPNSTNTEAVVHDGEIYLT
jgi:hypothetical protein